MTKVRRDIAKAIATAMHSDKQLLLSPDLSEEDFVFLCQAGARPNPLELERWRGLVPDEWLRKAYSKMRNWAYPLPVRLRLLELAGCITRVDGIPALQPGYRLVNNSPTDNPWDGSVVDAL